MGRAAGRVTSRPADPVDASERDVDAGAGTPPPVRRVSDVSPVDVLEVGITWDEDGTASPTVVLDVTRRPDIADLPRVHALEGVGDIATTLALVGSTALLTVTLTRPVRSEFTVAFVLPDHAEVLAHAALAGSLLLATTPPSAEGDHPLWLAVDLDGPRLWASLTGAVDG